MNGLFCVKKPLNMMSTQVVSAMRRILRTKTVGHGGTLDPAAEGVLVIGVGSGCKCLHKDFLHDQKVYVAIGELGRQTNTQDLEGEVVSTQPFDHVTLPNLQQCATQFLGTTIQTPPLYSALRFNGRRLYEHARDGTPVDLTSKQRPVTIYSIKILSFDPPYFTIEVCCSKGTYIRSLISDIGSNLGTVAVTTHINRTRQGPFTISDALPRDQWDFTQVTAVIEKYKTLME